MRDWLRLAVETARKDLLLELRAKRTLFLSTVFAMLVVVVFAFAFGRSLGTRAAVGRGALWVAFVFAGLVSVTRSAAVETADAAIEGLLLAPADRTAVYFGKVASNALFVFGVEVASLGFVYVFLQYTPPASALPWLAVTFAVAAVGFAAAGTLLALLAARSRLPELTLPVVLVPILVPILLGGVQLTRAFTGDARAGPWLQVLLAYDGILLLVGMVLFEPVVEG
jgi:heme exporter protein B